MVGKDRHTGTGGRRDVWSAQRGARRLSRIEERLVADVEDICIQVTEHQSDLDRASARSILIRLENTLLAIRDAVCKTDAALWDPTLTEGLLEDVREARREVE